MTETPFKFTRVRGSPLTKEEMVADLKRVAGLLGSDTVSQPQYSEHGKFDMRNLSRRLGGWSAALSAAGLRPTYEGEYTEDQLFSNLLTVWQGLGRQPRRVELAHPPSTISQSPYQRRFGSWTSALESFIAWANAADSPGQPPQPTQLSSSQPKTPRDPSLRLRFHVLQRDNFTCRSCGRSPATTPGTILHVDHIVPWSKGGETVAENLETKCEACNIGKSNVL